MDLQEFLRTLRSRWKFCIGTIVLGTIAAFLVVQNISPQYGSDVKLFVAAPTGSQTDFAANLSVPQRIASYAGFARDPSLVQQVIKSADLDMTYEELQKKIDAQVIPSTQTIQIDIKADTPALAQQIADAEAQELVKLINKLEKPVDDRIAPSIVAQVVSAPSFSDKQISPNVPLVILVGMLLSIFIGVAGALLRDLLDRTLKSRTDVEEVSGSAVLAALTYDSQVKKQPLSTETDGVFAEEIRMLRTNVQFVNVDSDAQTLLISSAVPDEGKTLVATNLALSMAQSGRSVLLIDADLRNPNVSKLLGLENSVGLVTALIGRTTLADSIQTHSSGVYFLATGPTPPNPAEVLGSNAMSELLRQVRTEYDTVIIDAPPILAVADASILLTQVDGVLLLARYASTTREQLRLAAERIETVGGRLLGTILNRVPRRSDESYGYGYGYGHTANSPQPAGRDRPAGKARRAARRAAR